MKVPPSCIPPDMLKALLILLRQRKAVGTAVTVQVGSLWLLAVVELLRNVMLIYLGKSSG
jgi:hypothetical protein